MQLHLRRDRPNTESHPPLLTIDRSATQPTVQEIAHEISRIMLRLSVNFSRKGKRKCPIFIRQNEMDPTRWAVLETVRQQVPPSPPLPPFGVNYLLQPGVDCRCRFVFKKKGQKRILVISREFVSYPIPQLKTKFVLLKKPLQKHYGCCCRLIPLNCRSTDHTYEALVLVFVSVPLQVCLKLNCISVNDKCRVY